jgi:hypothetical protein
MSSSAQCRVDKIVKVVYHRLFEWTMAFVMVFIGLHLILFPTSIAASSFDRLLHFIPEHFFAVVFLAAGLGRITALVVNGISPTLGPKVRGLGSSLGAVIWCQIAYSLYIHSVAGDIPPSPGIPVYAMLVIAEVAATYKAAADVRAIR